MTKIIIKVFISDIKKYLQRQDNNIIIQSLIGFKKLFRGFIKK